MSYTDFTDRVDAILAIPGTSVSKTFQDAREGYNHLRDLLAENGGQEALNAAVATGNHDTIRAALTAHTLAGLTVKDFDTRNEAERATLATLRMAYRKTADANYEAAADHYNATAKTLTTAAATIDINAPAETILRAPAKAITAWELAPVHARNLEQAAAVLHGAAALTGTTLTHTTHERHTDELLALTVDPTGVGIRDLWNHWDQDDAPHRAGRYGALAAAGATLRAADLDEFSPQRRPKPYVTEYIPDGYGHRPIQLDPEDPNSLTQIA